MQKAGLRGEFVARRTNKKDGQNEEKKERGKGHVRPLRLQKGRKQETKELRRKTKKRERGKGHVRPLRQGKL